MPRISSMPGKTRGHRPRLQTTPSKSGGSEHETSCGTLFGHGNGCVCPGDFPPSYTKDLRCRGSTFDRGPPRDVRGESGTDFAGGLLPRSGAADLSKLSRVSPQP